MSKIEAPFIIRCDVGQKIGLGHYYRCLSLKEALEKSAVKVILIVKPFDQTAISSIPSGGEEIDEFSLRNEIFILDLFYKKNHHNPQFKSYLANLKAQGNKIAFIEGLDDDAAPSAYYSYIDVLVTPYVIGQSTKIGPHPMHLCGKDFLMINPHKILPNKKIKIEANRLLISFGGSDPFHQSVQTIRQLAKGNIGQDMDVTVIMGPLVHPSQISLVKEYGENFKMLSVVHSPEDMRMYYEWADVAITSTGQTRYELAASGVPFVIFPFDEAGYRKSLVFKEARAAYLLENGCEQSIREAIPLLLKDYEERNILSNNGKEHFYNSRGAENLAHTLVERLI